MPNLAFDAKRLGEGCVRMASDNSPPLARPALVACHMASPAIQTCMVHFATLGAFSSVFRLLGRVLSLILCRLLRRRGSIRRRGRRATRGRGIVLGKSVHFVARELKEIER
jgi:hypothetical protein